jgi:uncharacterized membrane protein
MRSAFIAWFTGFVLMWVVLANMGVFPFQILFFAFPLSILEAFVATLIIVKLANTREKNAK